MKITEYDIRRSDLCAELVAIDEYEYKYNRKITLLQNINRFLNQSMKLSDIDYEEVWVIALDKCDIIGAIKVGSGERESAGVDFVRISTFLLLINASRFVFVHNHPYSNEIDLDAESLLHFSDSDKECNDGLTNLAQYLNVVFYDSIIICAGMYYPAFHQVHEIGVTIGEKQWFISRQDEDKLLTLIRKSIHDQFNKSKDFEVYFSDYIDLCYVNKSKYDTVIEFLEMHGGQYDAE